MRIRLVAYDPAWLRRFEDEAAIIRRALGDRALVIEHVGSTSVPGLAAKPVIDILLAVQDSADEAAYAAPLEAAGYRLHLREPAWFEHRLFKAPDNAVHLHAFSRDCPEINRMVAFRDRLRAHAEDRDLYARTKRALAEEEWQRAHDYADAKTAIVQEILSRTRV